MAQIINGKKLAEQIKNSIVKEIAKLKSERPNLAIILIGNREDSKLYVKIKEEEAKKVGIDTHLYRCPKNTTEQEVLEMIDCLNNDKLVNAILIQLPLPKNFDTDAIIRAIKPNKDVDGFHPDNLKSLFKTCDHYKIMPPVFKVVLKILESINCEIKNKKVCIVANSKIFSKSLSHVLECKQAKVNIASADEAGLRDKTSQADILITAIGKPKFIKKEIIKKDAVIIDIGIAKIKDKVCGDVDFEDVKEKAGYITPVPGGVGPLTIAMALRNTLELYKKRREE